MTSVITRIATSLTARSTFSSRALEMARNAVIDTIGCLLAGRSNESTVAVRRAFQAELPDEPVQLVYGSSTSASVVALANATAAHALDFDDNFHPARAHASAVLVPALLSLVRPQSNISGIDFLEAYLTGLEAQAAIGYGVNPAHYNRGWHGTSTVGAMGAAAGVTRLLGGNSEEVAHAISIAASMASGLKGQFGTPTKPLHAGFAARNAVDAARLAMSGMRGSVDILEKRQGFLDLFGTADSRGWSDWCADDASVIETRGLVVKQHPCCASTHRAIDAALDLKLQYALVADDIAAIETKVGISAFRNLAFDDPLDEMEARFSMQYCLATAFVKGRLSLEDFTPKALQQSAARQLMPRIKMTAYTEEEERGQERLPHVVFVTLRDGRVLQRTRLHARGALQDPLTEDQRQAKFNDCLVWAGVDAPDLYDRLMNMANRAPLFEQLADFAG